ncbi:MAG: hypothetical protein RLZ35_294 [Pseudomonadota bacterium]|jgi:hypothetical protein
MQSRPLPSTQVSHLTMKNKSCCRVDTGVVFPVYSHFASKNHPLAPEWAARLGTEALQALQRRAFDVA